MKNKIELKVFQQSYVDKLFRDVVSTNNFDNYKADHFPYEEKFPRGNTGIFISEDFTLDADKSDFENSKALYEELKTLNETQASDERLWVYLTHVTFWKYMRKRWSMEKSSEGKEIGRLKDRYFLRTPNIETLTRNGIARLWWYAHLTYDTAKTNPYELTEVLLKRADLSVGITERALGSNKNIRTALLEFLKDNPTIASNEDKTREVYKTLNLVGGVRNLPFLEITELRQILDDVKATIEAAA
ncbi:MAG TPA: DUF6339 family protein [Chitinophagaceae bacterium]|nr:DUF6339 family protein [Chitinophagaceae bacterium]